MWYRDRDDAGRRLADLVVERIGDDPVDLVAGVPRGGVIVAAPVAAVLGVDLDIAVARKLGAPGQPELGIGAVALAGPPILNKALIGRIGVDDETLEAIVAAERAEALRRERLYRSGRDVLTLDGKVVVVVDDGVATGATVVAVARRMRAAATSRVIIAVPVAPPETIAALEREADEVICLLSPHGFRAVGQWFDDFAQVADDDVVAALDARRR